MENGWRFLNVDLSTETGIRKAQAWNLTSSRKADIVISPLLHHATSLLFSNSQKARLFFVMRHPLERVVSLFYYLQNATHEPTYNPLFQHMTLQEYANSSWVESNFMVRVSRPRHHGKYKSLVRTVLTAPFLFVVASLSSTKWKDGSIPRILASPLPS